MASEAEAVGVLKSRREELTYRLQEVEAMLTLLGANEDEEEPEEEEEEAPAPRRRGKATPRAGHSPGTKGGPLFDRILPLLGQEELGIKEIARRLDLSAGTVGPVIRKSPYFEKSGPGLRAPYRLTAEGRAALRALPSANGAH